MVKGKSGGVTGRVVVFLWTDQGQERYLQTNLEPELE